MEKGRIKIGSATSPAEMAERNRVAIEEEAERQRALAEFAALPMEQKRAELRRRERAARAARIHLARMEGNVLPGPPENKAQREQFERNRAALNAERNANRAAQPAPQPLPDVEYASPQAVKLAAEAGLAAEDFAGFEPSGKTGYTLDDVRGVIDVRNVLNGEDGD